MYIYPARTYYRGSEQFALRAPFLLLLQPRKESISETCAPGNLYAVVRKVGLKQCGHWMMGSANLCGKWVSVSGPYGSDGLPMTVEVLPKDAVQVPDWLYEKWNKGGGHNGAGSEAEDMVKWARETFK